MKTKYYLLTLSVIFALTLAACGGQATLEPTETAFPTDMVTEVPTATEAAIATEVPTTTATVVIPVTGGGTLNVMEDPSGGSFLVDGDGMTVYINTSDTPDTSSCYDACAAEWMPVVSSGDDASVVGEGVDATKLGTLTRTDGMIQVTYNGWPLYTFASDTQTGDMVGQGAEGMWFMVSPTGESIQTMP